MLDAGCFGRVLQLLCFALFILIKCNERLATLVGYLSTSHPKCNVLNGSQPE